MELSKDQLTKEQRRQLKAQRRLEKNLGAKEVSKTSSDDQLLEPVRQHFKNDPYAKKLVELVRSFQVTR